MVNKKLEKLVRTAMRQKAKTLKPANVTVGWPVFDHKEVLSALEQLMDIRISQGPRVEAFERACAQYIGVPHAAAVNSGSSANLIALTTLVESGDVPKGSEVIVPAATFATVTSPITQAGLVPVYVDVDPYSWNIDPNEIKKAITKKTKVIMPVHSMGNPADMSTIMRIARKHKLIVLEDCCEAHGATIGKKKVGSFGDIATWSFFVAHNMTTGEGGMVFTKHKRYYEMATSLREFGRPPLDVVRKERFTYRDPVLGQYDTRYVFERLGYNVRMTDIAASIGLVQIKKLNQFNKERIKVVRQYNRAFAKYRKYIRLPQIRKGTFNSFYGYQMVVEKNAPFRRRDLTLFLEDRGIETRPFMAGCLPDQPGFRKQHKKIIGRLPISRWLRDNAFFIGCHPALSSKQVRHMIETFGEFFQRLQQNL